MDALGMHYSNYIYWEKNLNKHQGPLRNNLWRRTPVLFRDEKESY